MVEITLPWPPSINNYWRHTTKGHYISAAGQKYRSLVILSCRLERIAPYEASQRLQVIIEASPPDRRKRDLDNVLKSLLDSLQHAGVYADDSQIDHLYIYRNDQFDGTVKVSITTECHRLQRDLAQPLVA